MLTLNQLKNQYGNPDILIDSSSKNSNKYAVWGFKEVFEINTNGCFHNDQLITGKPFLLLQDFITQSQNKTNTKDIACVGFVSYDFKNIIYDHIPFKNKENNNFPLLWFCKPKLIKPYLENNEINNSKGALKMTKDIISLSKYAKKINLIKSHLKDGNVYQINFTSKKKFQSTFNNSFDLYNSLKLKAKPKQGFFLHTNKFDILSFSPELFIKIDDGKIQTSPIKGTRPRSKNKTKDLALKKELINSKKDKAEHLMIVDLLRNDLGKICKIGSIKVRDLYAIKSFPTVHHMVTKILGQIKDDISETEIIKAMFPGGSITGAPKESAMKIINELEEENRHIYTGSAGYICNNGDMSFNICIRTLLKFNDIYEYGIGGGIVWDSNIQDEWNEAHQKSEILSLL
tara:strand:- start:4935 stop:6137 length:1203 start_codon:yes stop_codon:yes gene_type:complete